MTQSTIRIISPGRNPADSLAGLRFRIDDGQSELPAGAYVLTLQVLDESGLPTKKPTDLQVLAAKYIEAVEQWKVLDAQEPTPVQGPAGDEQRRDARLVGVERASSPEASRRD